MFREARLEIKHILYGTKFRRLATVFGDSCVVFALGSHRPLINYHVQASFCLNPYALLILATRCLMSEKVGSVQKIVLYLSIYMPITFISQYSF